MQRYSKRIDGIIIVIVHSEDYLTTVKYQKRSEELPVTASNGFTLFNVKSDSNLKQNNLINAIHDVSN